MTKTKQKGFDLALLDTKAASEHSFPLQLRHPHTDEPLGAVIHIVGDECEAVRDFTRKLMQKTQSRESLARKRGKDVVPQLEELEEAVVDSAVARTTGWDDLWLGGEAVVFSEQKARELYAQYEWIRTQVMDASKDLGNFIKG